MWGVARGGGSKRSTLAGAHRCVDGEASVADAAVFGTVGCAHQGSIVRLRGRRAAVRARAPVHLLAGRIFIRVPCGSTVVIRGARLVGLGNALALVISTFKHYAFAPHNQNH